MIESIIRVQSTCVHYMSPPYNWASRSVPLLGSQPSFLYTRSITSRCHTSGPCCCRIGISDSYSRIWLQRVLRGPGILLAHTLSLAKGTRIVASCGQSTCLTSTPLSYTVKNERLFTFFGHLSLMFLFWTTKRGRIPLDTFHSKK